MMCIVFLLLVYMYSGMSMRRFVLMFGNFILLARDSIRVARCYFNICLCGYGSPKSSNILADCS